MRYVALTGDIKSGKTTVAEALSRDHGFYLLSYTNVLKAHLAGALTQAGMTTTLGDILRHKERYRGLLQEWGAVVGFNHGGKFLSDTLASVPDGMPGVVFDCVRTDEQAQLVRAVGFTVVRLHAKRAIRAERILACGDDPAQVLAREGHAAERGVSDALVNRHLSTEFVGPAALARYLAAEEDEDNGYQA